MVHALGDVEQQILNAVIDAETAWRTPEELAARLRWTLDETLDVIVALDVAGWLDSWELTDGPVVTLSVAASDRLGVRLVEVGVDETPRWARAGDLDPISRRAAGVFRSERMAQLDLVADNRPGVEQVLIHQEEVEQAALDPAGAVRSSRLEPAGLRPTLLIGTGLTPWPGPRQAVGAVCPACRFEPLPSHAYCIHCDRSGRDAVESAGADPLFPLRVASVSARRSESRPAEQRRESERKRRQNKRKRRRDTQAKLGRTVSRLVVPLWMAPVAG